jgi:hypothetical protein
MRGPSGNEDKRSGRHTHDAVAELDPKLSSHDVEKLVRYPVDMSLPRLPEKRGAPPGKTTNPFSPVDIAVSDGKGTPNTITKTAGWNRSILARVDQ